MAITFFNTVKHFAQFAAKHLANGGKLVDQNTANMRSDICLRCHNNKPSNEVRKDCSTCQKLGTNFLDSIRSKIIGSKKTVNDRAILTCAICGCDIKMMVWMPNATLISKEDANAYPEFCWKKKILEGEEL